MGILQCAVELGWIDITHDTATLAKFMSNPCEGHLKAVVRVSAYLKKQQGMYHHEHKRFNY